MSNPISNFIQGYTESGDQYGKQNSPGMMETAGNELSQGPGEAIGGLGAGIAGIGHAVAPYLSHLAGALPFVAGGMKLVKPDAGYLPNDVAKQVGSFMMQHEAGVPYSIQDTDHIMRIAQDHAKIPLKNVMANPIEQVVGDIAGNMSPNQRYAYYHLPSALLKRGGK